MSINFDSHSPPDQPNKLKNVDVLEPGVSLVKPQRRYSRSVTILTRVFFAVLFLGAGVVAVVYSIRSSEQDEQDRHHVALTDFDLYHDQVSWQGKLTIERNTTGKRTLSKYDVIWLQDDTHSRMLFNVSDPTKNTYTAYYVFQNHTLYVTENGCVFHDLGYDDFIMQFGVIGLVKSDNDTVELNGKFQRVEVFQGVPAFNITEGSIPLPGYQSGRPRLAFAYSLPHRGVTCGWQMYFDPIGDKRDFDHTEWIEYWFNDMTEQEPDAENFVDYTGKCVGTPTPTPEVF